MLFSTYRAILFEVLYAGAIEMGYLIVKSDTR